MRRFILSAIAMLLFVLPVRANAVYEHGAAPLVQSERMHESQHAAVSIEQLMEDLCLGGILDFLNQIKNLLDAISDYIQALGDLFDIGIDPPTFNPQCFQDPSIQLPDFSSCLMAGLDVGSFDCDCQLPNLDFQATIDNCLDDFQIDLGGFNPEDCIGLPDIQFPDLWGQLQGLLDLILSLLDLDLNLDALATIQIACAEGVTVGARTGGSSLVKVKKKILCKDSKKKKPKKAKKQGAKKAK